MCACVSLPPSTMSPTCCLPHTTTNTSTSPSPSPSSSPSPADDTSLPSRMEAFTVRVFLRAAQQYAKLVEFSRTKPGVAKGGIDLTDFWRNRGGKATEKTSGSSNSNTSSSFRRWRRVKNFSNQNTTNNEVSTKKETPATPDEEGSLLKIFALNALDLTAPASDILLKNRQNSWFQLSGHADCFAPAGPGTIWKKRNGGCENAERQVYESLAADPIIHDVVPRYYREVEYRDERFIELQDLLHGFQDPHVMDVKMGTRTFLESEVQKTTARHDLYLKMVAVDPQAPTAEEHEAKAVTKLRYMQFREQQSSTCSQGFRIEAMKLRGSAPVTDLKKVKCREELVATLVHFLGGREETRKRLLERLRVIREKFEACSYFRHHEVVGSSIFIIYDDHHVGAWIIDFAKTHPVPEGISLNHRRPWSQGNHEEGFLYGLDSLISIIEEMDLVSYTKSVNSLNGVSLGP